MSEAAWHPALLEGEIALVTGAGRGIGLATALELAKAGARVVLLERESDRLESALGEVKAVAGEERVRSVQADVTDFDSVSAAVETVGKQWGPVSILVNNAGILRDAFISKMSLTQFDEVIDVHLRGNFICSKVCVEAMKVAGHGAIVSLSSSTGPYGNPGQVNYGAAKAGIIGITRTLAVELARFNIRVNAIAPGAIDTAMINSIPAKVREGFLSMIPLGRFGSPSEVGCLVTFLASPLASYITGAVVFIDGGFTVAG
jgi:3-oxoacyl-[acyl-carrier protein] reductase